MGVEFVVLLGATLLHCHVSRAVNSTQSFTPEFLFGTATAAYQIEGAWNKDGKGESIWDHIVHMTPSPIHNQDSGDVAADSYKNYKRDVQMLRELGVDLYRFSISWTRVLPSGFSNEINPLGLAYYSDLIDELLKFGIQPIVTLYHWDLPQKLQDLGGWANPLIADWFEDYSQVLFDNLGDRVKYWITINEPSHVCSGYGSARKAPGINSSGIGEYICAKNILLAHARAYHLYNDTYKGVQKGEIGMTDNIFWYGPRTKSKKDAFAAKLAQEFNWGLYSEPIYSKEGGFPKELVARIAQKSSAQGFPRSRLPKLTEAEVAFIRGTSDYFGMNHYTGYLVSASEGLEVNGVPSVKDDLNVGVSTEENWPKSFAPWLKHAPNSMYNLLTQLHVQYSAPTFFILENGWPTPPGLQDHSRVQYHRDHLQGVLDAMDEGVKVKGYVAWSLMDNFEWMEGYAERFGLYEVDFTDPERKRSPRASAFVYKNIVKTRRIDHDYWPDGSDMTIDEGRERFGLYEVDFTDPERKRSPRASAFVYKNIVKTRRIDHDYWPDGSDMTIDEGR